MTEGIMLFIEAKNPVLPLAPGVEVVDIDRDEAERDMLAVKNIDTDQVLLEIKSDLNDLILEKDYSIESAATLISNAYVHIKKIQEKYEPYQKQLTDPYHKTKQAIIDKFKELKTFIDKSYAVFIKIDEKVKTEDQRRKDEKQKELDRIAEEQRKMQDDALLNQAEQLEKQGMTKEAETLIDTAPTIPTMTATYDMPVKIKTDAGTVSETDDFEPILVDVVQFIIWLAANPAQIGHIMSIDIGKGILKNPLKKAMEMAKNGIPGIERKEVSKLNIRTKK